MGYDWNRIKLGDLRSDEQFGREMANADRGRQANTNSGIANNRKILETYYKQYLGRDLSEEEWKNYWLPYADGADMEMWKQKVKDSDEGRAILNKQAIDSSKITEEDIKGYMDLFTKATTPELQAQVNNLASQFSMGGSPARLNGDAYARAMTKVAADMGAKNFENALGLAKTDKERGWGLLTDDKDWTRNENLAKYLSGEQSKNKTPDWAYLLDFIGKAIPG